MTTNRIITERLLLIPVTLEIINTLLKGERDKLDELGITFHKKWPREDTIDIAQILARSMKADCKPSGFEMWMVVKKENMTVIGDAGFKGAPDEKGVVEIGYGLVDDERKKGYGFELAEALAKWALSQETVKTLKADCLVNNQGSIRILQKLGMQETGRDEEFIYWEIRK